MLISLRCPQCDGELSVEEGKETYFCPYCGTKVVQKPEPKADASSANDPDVLFDRWVNTYLHGGDLKAATRLFHQKCFDDPRVRVIDIIDEYIVRQTYVKSFHYRWAYNPLKEIVDSKPAATKGENELLAFLMRKHVILYESELKEKKEKEEWEAHKEEYIAEQKRLIAQEQRKREEEEKKKEEEKRKKEQEMYDEAMKKFMKHLLIRLLVFLVAVGAMTGYIIYSYKCDHTLRAHILLFFLAPIAIGVLSFVIINAWDERPSKQIEENRIRAKWDKSASKTDRGK